jgi:hypothetical protein
MRYTSLSKTFLAMAVISTAAFSSCKKDKIDATNPVTEEENISYIEDQASTEQTFDEVSTLADRAVVEGASALKGASFKLSGCATVNNDTTVTPHVLTIDFGPTNCMCADGRNRRGKILVSYNGRYRDSGHVHTITFDGYHVDNHKVLGSKQVTNMGHNSSSQTFFNIAVNGMVIKPVTGDTITRIATRTRTWTAGESTLVKNDDVYEITGKDSTVRASGKIFTANITSPLVVAVNCNWIKQGVIQITPQGGTPRTLNYGSGTCDKFATVTVGTKSRTITLK